VSLRRFGRYRLPERIEGDAEKTDKPVKVLTASPIHSLQSVVAEPPQPLVRNVDLVRRFPLGQAPVSEKTTKILPESPGSGFVGDG
jgi:hypothetical protein